MLSTSRKDQAQHTVQYLRFSIAASANTGILSLIDQRFIKASDNEPYLPGSVFHYSKIFTSNENVKAFSQT